MLYRSLKKYGFDKHNFEILEECSESELNDKERYYQDLYSVIDRNGLNCKLTKTDDRSGRYSEESITFYNSLLNGQQAFENWVNSFTAPASINDARCEEINKKFEAFKKWALTLK